MNDWVETTIGDVAAVFDGPHATPAKVSEGPVFLGISCLSGGRLDLTATDHLSETDFKRWTRRVEPTAGDVVFSFETRLGEAALIPRGLRCCLGRRMALIRPDRGKIDSRFLLYYYLSPEFQELIRSRTVAGSTVDRILLEEFPTFPIRVPDLATQREVASLLGALDDKVELNSRMNQTLESVARAIFRSWFVDFDPVVAKAASRQPFGMSADVAALFPREFHESGEGGRPLGWVENPIEMHVGAIYDGPHATPPPAESGPVFLGIRNMTGSRIDLGEVRHISEDQWARWTRRVTPEAGDIVFTYEASVGAFAVIPRGTRCCLGRRLALVRPARDRYYPYFLLHTFVSEPFQELLASRLNQGSTVERIPLTDFPQYPILWPGDELVQRFEQAAEPLWRSIHVQTEQSRTLAALRDTLLPKLMSGELRVRDAERLVGTHV